jgi:hypothetical protein
VTRDARDIVDVLGADAPAGSRIDQIIWRDPASSCLMSATAGRTAPSRSARSRSSIDRFGFTNPILLREDGESIGAGHGRQLASLLEPKLDRVPTLIVAA